MRTLTFGTATVLIPDITAFDGDINRIEAYDSTYPISVEIKITHHGGTAFRKLKYSSELKYISFMLSDSVNSMMGELGTMKLAVDYDIKVALLIGGVWTLQAGYGVTYSTTFYHGMSLPDRYHGSATFAPVAPNGQVSLFFPWQPSAVRIDGVTYAGALTEGVNVLTVGASSKNIHIDYGADLWLGDMTNWQEVDGWDVRLVHAKTMGCEADVLVTYTDTDGCKHTVSGSLQDTAVEVERADVRKVSLYRNAAAAKLTKASRTHRIVFYCVPFGQYLTDIIYADDVTVAMGDRTISAVVTDTSVTEADKLQNIEINIKTMD